MSALTGFGALLGGATEEAGKIRKERHDKEQADLQLATSMLQHIIENPNIVDPNIKAQAQEAWRDVVFEHMMPDNYKGGKTNPVRKLVDQFIGQQSSSPAMAQKISQVGVGRGNATSQVGGTSMPPPPPNTQAGSAPIAGAPPSPASAGLAPVQSVGGFVNPIDASRQEAQFKANLEVDTQQRIDQNRAGTKLSTDQKEVEQKKAFLESAPWFQQLSDQQKAQAMATLVGSNFTPGQPSYHGLYNGQTGKEELWQIMPDGTKKMVGEGDIAPTEKERMLRTEAQAKVGTAEVPADWDAETIYKNLVKADSEMQRARYMAQTEDERAGTALKRAEANWYAKRKEDPEDLQRGKFFFDALNNAQAMATAQWKAAQEPKFAKDPKTGEWGMQQQQLDYGKVLDDAIEINARSVGLTGEQLKQFAVTGKLPTPGEMPTTAPAVGGNPLGLAPPPPPSAAPAKPSADAGKPKRGFLDLLRDVISRDFGLTEADKKKIEDEHKKK